MKRFKGKFKKKGEGDHFKRCFEKSFRKTGKNLILFDPYTIFIPNYRASHGWWD